MKYNSFVNPFTSCTSSFYVVMKTIHVPTHITVQELVKCNTMDLPSTLIPSIGTRSESVNETIMIL